MSRQEILEKLKAILEYTVADAAALLPKVSEQSELYTDLGLNSVGMLYIVIAIEETFGIRFDGVRFGDFKTVADVIDYIEKKLTK